MLFEKRARVSVSLPKTVVVVLLVVENLLMGMMVSSASTQVDVSGLYGKEVRLPCQIDTKTCGTLHSIKWYRGSSRIYVFSDAIKFHKPEGDYSTRAQLVYNPNDTISYLEVKNLNIDDEAVYKCEITYLDVIESCLVVQFINLTALIEPKEIKVTLDSAEVQNGSTIGPFNEGETISLTCEVSEGKPIPSLYWYKDNKQTNGHYVPNVGTNAMGSAKNRIDIKLSRNDLGATYVCQSFVQGLNHSLSFHVGIDVNVKPVKTDLKPSIKMPVSQNTSVTLFCFVHQAKPGANVTWYNGSIPLDRRDNQIVDEEDRRPDGTFDTRSRLTFIATRHENNRIFRCRAWNPAISREEQHSFEDQLEVQVRYPPHITISPEEITVNETSEVLLSCDYVANPGLKEGGVVWYFNGRRIVANATLYEFFDTKLRLKKVDRHSLGSYFCSLANEVGVSNSSEVMVNVLYHPTVYVDTMTPTTVNETDKREISLLCKVISGNPGELNEVRWFHNGQLLQNSNVTNLVLEGVRSNHGNYSCAGKTIAGLGPTSPVIEVKVQRLPGPAKLIYYQTSGYVPVNSVNSVVIKGNTIELRCEVQELGWPLNTQYHFYRGNVEIIGTPIGNKLSLQSVGILEKLNNFSCNAANVAGYGENATISIDIHAPPNIINTIKYANATISDTTFDIKCDFECYPECEVTWKRNGTIIDNSTGEYEILNVNMVADPNRNDFEGVSSTLRLNIKAFPEGKLVPNRDDAQYTCSSSGNDVGPGVESNIDFRVHFPPINMSINNKNGSIREGNIPPRVQCISFARPSATYRWFNPTTGKNESHEAILNLNRPLNRFNDSTFVCEASNAYGKNYTNLTFVFEYKPSCVIEQIEDNDKKELYCRAIGSPPQIDYAWSILSKEVSTNKTLDWKTEKYILDYSNNDERYYCTASNSVGTSDPCWIDVPASTDWAILRLLKNQHYVIYVAIAFGIIFLVIIICSMIIFICHKRRANEKYNNRIDLPSRPNLDAANNITDGTTPAPMMPKWPLKPGVLVHVNNNHMLNARRSMGAQNNQNNNHNNNNNNNHNHMNSTSNGTNNNQQNQNHYYTASEKRPKRGEILKNIGNESQRSRTQRIKHMFFAEQLKYKTDTLPGVFHGKSGVVSFKKFDNSVVPTNPRKRKKPGTGSNDLSNKNKNSFHSANDALLQPDNDKAFYENLPFHGMQNPPNKSQPPQPPQQPPPPPPPPAETEATRPPSSQSQYDGSSGYGSTRSRNTGTGAGSKSDQQPEPTEGEDGRFNSLRPKRSRPNWPQFRSLRTPKKKNKIPMLPIKESSPAEPKNSNTSASSGEANEVEQVPKILPKPVPAPRKVIGFSFNKPSAKHTYQNVPIPITPNTVLQTSTPIPDKAKASTHLTNSSPMEYFRLTPTNKTCRQYNVNGSITTNLSLKKSTGKNNAQANNVLSPTFPRGGPPTVPRHHDSSYPSTHHLNNGMVYADLTVSRHKKKHHRHPPISNAQTYPYHTEYAVIKFHDVGREIDV